MTSSKLHPAAVHALLAIVLSGWRPVHAQSRSQVDDQPASPAMTSSTDASSPRSGADTSPRVELSEVVVTGTRIVGAIPTSPVITLDRTMIDQSGYASVGQLLLAIPQNFSGGQNPGVVGARGNNFSISGASSPDIHGLGPDSTLTLVDGHRFAYDGYTNGVDLSTIPLAAIDRVEVLTDGASAIYGSDAVAGVVNVILKQHYDGLTADARYGDVTSGHSARAQYSALGGHDWTSGSALLAYEYSHEDPLYSSDRPFSAGAAQPTTLFPELNRNSGFIDVHQDLWAGAEASVEGLYTSRSNTQAFTLGKTSTHLDTRVTQFGISPSVSVELPGKWHMALVGTVSHDEDALAVTDLAAGTTRVTSTGGNSYVNDLRVGELQATGPLLDLPSGPVKLAVGGGYRSERFRDERPPTDAVPPSDASRAVEYGYGELELPIVEPSAARPLLQRLDLSAAFRYEHYSDFGAQSTPKVGLVYVPSDYLRVRTTWSESFRAPELLDAYGSGLLYLFQARTLGGASGSTALIEDGSNPKLRPETAESTTVGFDVLWPGRPTFRITPTYFRIDYRNRIVFPVDDTLHALSNPEYAPFVTRGPTPAAVQTLVSQAESFVNFSGGPYDPARVSAIIDDRYQNATVQKIRGVDLTARDDWPLLGGDLGATASGTWLEITQRVVSTAPSTEVTGTIFNPPKFKSRVSATWRRGGFGFTATFNYVGPESDDSGKIVYPVSSWSTVDAQLSYAFDGSVHGVFRGVRASLAVQNLLDRDPPHIASASTEYPALSYDSTNASPIGRFVSAYVAKSW